jgi:hypothetical protein
MNRLQRYLARLQQQNITASPLTLLQARYQMQDTMVTNVPHDITPGSMFDRIFDDGLKVLIVDYMNELLDEEGKRLISVKEFSLYLVQYLQLCAPTHRDIRHAWRAEYHDPRALSKHRFFHIHANREFPLQACFDYVIEKTLQYLILGSEVCIDELHTDFTGPSPVSAFNASKPHPWGQLVFLASLRLNGRSIIVGAKPKTPDFFQGHPKTDEVIKELNEALPVGATFHFTMDSFYNTKGVREYLDEQPNRFYTMAGKTEWFPHVWRVLQSGLPFGEWRQMVCAPKHLVFSCYHSNKKMNTLSNAFNTTPALVTPAIPPLYQVYRSHFNLVDLFNRIYFAIAFHHRQHGWQNNFFDVFLKIALINSWVLYNAATNNTITIRDFIAHVVEHLYANPI